MSNNKVTYLYREPEQFKPRSVEATVARVQFEDGEGPERRVFQASVSTDFNPLQYDIDHEEFKRDMTSAFRYVLGRQNLRLLRVEMLNSAVIELMGGDDDAVPPG